MDELKNHFQHVILWESNNNKNSTKTAKKISCGYGQSVVTDHQVWNWFSKFRSGHIIRRDVPRPERSSHLDQEALRELVECNLCESIQELALEFSAYDWQSATTWKR